MKKLIIALLAIIFLPFTTHALNPWDWEDWQLDLANGETCEERIAFCGDVADYQWTYLENSQNNADTCDWIITIMIERDLINGGDCDDPIPECEDSCPFWGGAYIWLQWRIDDYCEWLVEDEYGECTLCD